MKTAILDRFSAELIDAIDLGEKDIKQSFTGAEFVEWLLKSNLFIVELDDERKWFRYHHLF